MGEKSQESWAVILWLTIHPHPHFSLLIFPVLSILKKKFFVFLHDISLWQWSTEIKKLRKIESNDKSDPSLQN